MKSNIKISEQDQSSYIKNQKLIPVKIYLQEFPLLKKYLEEKVDFVFAYSQKRVLNIFEDTIIPFKDDYPEDEQFVYLFIFENIKEIYDKYGIILALSYFGHTKNITSSIVHRIKNFNNFDKEIEYLKKDHIMTNIHPNLAFNSFFFFMNYLENNLFNRSVPKHEINLKRRSL